MIDVNTGEVFTQEEMQEKVESSTTEEIRKMYDQMVEVKGNPIAIATLSGNLATSQANLNRLHEEARQRTYKKLK